MTNDSHKARLAALVQELSVIHEKVTLASGRESDFYVDMRRSTLHHEAAPLIGRVMLRLLEGSPDVLKLLAINPFPERPPRYIRATLYDYRMTDRETHRSTGAWWSRERVGLYLPPLSLASGGTSSRLQWHAGE